MEVSPVREQIAVEFEHVAGRKHITYINAFKTLIPLPGDHFLARRFADADKLEKEAKKDPIAVVKVLLRDLGPKTAAEIKDELCELVIPEADWTKWWQAARAKLKKDPIVQTPENIKDVFVLRKTEVSHEERMKKAFHSKNDHDGIIQTSYNLVRDLPKTAKKHEVNQTLKDKLLDLLNDPHLNKTQELQILILLEDYFSHIESQSEHKDLTKKIYNLLLNKRYAIVRSLLENTDIAYVKEILLLASKCQTFTDHDQKILRSLAEVVHPSLAAAKQRKGHNDHNIIWTTEAGYLKTQERAKQIGTVEIVENAREIEAARALGDLGEGSAVLLKCRIASITSLRIRFWDHGKSILIPTSSLSNPNLPKRCAD